VNVKKLLVIPAAAAVLFAGVTGCSSGNSKGSSDEQQIRDLLNQEQSAASALDFDKMVDLTCSKYRDEQRKQVDDLIPPLSQYGTADDLSGTSDQLAAKFKEQFPNVSDDAINALANAIANYDQAAYEKAFKDLLRQTMKLKIDKVENIKVNGDNATADVTSTKSMGNEGPKTETKNIPFVKENGQWKDCSEPSSS